MVDKAFFNYIQDGMETMPNIDKFKFWTYLTICSDILDF